MPSRRNKLKAKNKGKHYFIPNLVKDIKEMKWGKDLSGPQPKRDAVSIFVQVRGM